MGFQPDYPGAIVVQARNYGYIVNGKHLTNNPKAWCLHTPEEPPDNVPSTPYYFAETNRDASTIYFVSYLGFVFQCVPESEGAYANAVEGKPYPAWADSTVNLNLQTLSIEIEGYAATIHQTMPRGSPQWKALVALMAHRCKALNIPPGRTFGHYQVSVYRSDPGQLNIPLLVTDVIAALQEEEMPTREEFEALTVKVLALERFQVAHTRFVRDRDTTAAFLIQDGEHRLVTPEAWAATERDDAEFLTLPHDEVIRLAPTRGPDLTVEEARLFANPHQQAATVLPREETVKIVRE